MKPVEFEGQTTLLGPPDGAKRGSCGALPIIRFEGCMSSFWKPTAEELAELNAGAHVQLTIFGGAHPPVWLGVQRVVELP